jgi:glycosyltransferase involved in cell wall biosynthesis
MPFTPLVSVIIPAYNTAAWLEDAVQSVETQDFRDFEIVLIDDGSTDQTPEWATREGKRFRYYRQSNRGPGAARNLAANQAEGEYLAFLDADDIWLPGKLSRQAEALASAPNRSFVFTDGYRLVSNPVNKSREKQLFNCPRLSSLYAHPENPLTIDLEFRIHCIPTSSVLVRRKDYLSVGGMPILRTGEDFVLFCLLLVQNPAIFIDEPLFIYRVHQDNTSAKVRNKRQAWANIRSLDQSRILFTRLSGELGHTPAVARQYARAPFLVRFFLLFCWRIALGSSRKKVLADILRYLSA